MNIIASMTTRALREHGVADLPCYRKALVTACNASPPPFGRSVYAKLYRKMAADPKWVALSILGAAKSEGEGATHLWDMAACTTDPFVAAKMQEHAIDESRHS